MTIGSSIDGKDLYNNYPIGLQYSFCKLTDKKKIYDR